MAVKNKDEIMSALGAITEGNTTDDVLALLEDVADTLDALATTGEWEEKYKQLDNEWREKYKARFFEVAETADEMAEKADEIDAEEDDKEMTYDKLFKTKEV